MERLNSPVDILKILEKTNCRECGEPTCLAFASAVFQGRRRLSDCPRLAPALVERYEGKTATRKTVDEGAAEAVDRLKNRVAAVDLAEAAQRLEGRMSGDSLLLKVCGKDVRVDPRGNLTSEIHVHPWIAVPVLSYVLEGAGAPVTGTWVPFRELEGGGPWQGLFEQRCERPVKAVADTYTDLFEDMLHVFNGRQVESLFDSDISIVLHPLPRVPVLYCYWRPDDGMASDLHIFFDTATNHNLPIGAAYSLAGGLARMFEKVAQRHGMA